MSPPPETAPCTTMKKHWGSPPCGAGMTNPWNHGGTPVEATSFQKPQEMLICLPPPSSERRTLTPKMGPGCPHPGNPRLICLCGCPSQGSCRPTRAALCSHSPVFWEGQGLSWTLTFQAPSQTPTLTGGLVPQVPDSPALCVSTHACEHKARCAQAAWDLPRDTSCSSSSAFVWLHLHVS